MTTSSPGRSPKPPLPGIGIHDPLDGRQACPEFITFDQGSGKVCPRYGLFLCRFLPKRGQMCYILSPPQSLNWSSFLGWLRAKWFDVCWFPLSTCADSPGAPGRRQTDRHEAHTFDGYITREV